MHFIAIKYWFGKLLMAYFYSIFKNGFKKELEPIDQSYDVHYFPQPLTIFKAYFQCPT